MKIVKQLAIFLENRPGTLAKVCRALAKAEINVLALAVSDTVDHAVVRIVVDKPKEASYLLAEGGLLVLEQDVIMAEVPNKPGVLARIAGTLSRAKVNIEYAYCAASPDHDPGTMVLRVSDARKGLRALKKIKRF